MVANVKTVLEVLGRLPQSGFKKEATGRARTRNFDKHR